MKFRVWDKKYNEYAATGDFYINANGELVSEWGSPECERHFKNADDPGYQVEYSTGLKDKNDQEIYEGDIVRIHNSRLTVSSVKFKNGAFQIYYDCGNNNRNSGYRMLCEWESEYLEISGNINENAELLEK